MESFGRSSWDTRVTTPRRRICLQFNGDYAGFTQAWLEAHHPGATALFVAGCGGDANPYPRGTIELAQQHGEELAAAVEKVLAGELQPVRSPIKTAYEEFPVAFATPPGREELQAQLENQDVNHRNWAAAMLKILDRDGHLPNEYPYPLEIWQFGQDLTFIALGGEVVVDYDLRLKKELGAEKLWVAAYSMTYLPTSRHCACLRKAATKVGAPWFITANRARLRRVSRKR